MTTLSGLSRIPRGQEKLSQVTSIVEQLQKDITEKAFSISEQTKLLEELKILGRDPQNADPIFTKDGITLLAAYGFERKNQEALRCLANAMFLKPQARKLFLDKGLAPTAIGLLKSRDFDDQFLISRILFLLTYESKTDFTSLDKDGILSDAIPTDLRQHAQRYAEVGRQPSDTAIEEMALCELLKLTFNLTHFHPSFVPSLSSSIPDLFDILRSLQGLDPPMKPPANLAVNALLNLVGEGNEDQNSIIFPEDSPSLNSSTLLDLLQQVTGPQDASGLEDVLPSLLTLLRKIYKIAPESVKQDFHTWLLPSDSERDQPLGRSGSLPARLLQLSASSLSEQTRLSISAMLFELSGEDASRFIKNIGYGYAAGFLLAQKIDVPAELLEASETEDGDSVPINPITGQRLDAEPAVAGPPMTDEEKEREAERLFVLFERLRQTGVVDVRNPVAQALEEGRFEELE
ncbi:hypothetical protein P152DRAFT_459060 [Eremomyces bilateralis CBS 781.70]|uniref:Guanine nucleotide exchange factor n=1 Tax=Eremomyces bilateralis CBS 781.70 TaxID=1392243 RepID=A0A6G1G1W6_9PEZI|nr:uncharacterized protein P152DRAFT_459060 [Eremomyces bilateralis CBS 781.70]KAF1812105.1 hypothetical protein P152DRAFT_459060 [Eremomyces bilateralis CBS 781.70]